MTKIAKNHPNTSRRSILMGAPVAALALAAGGVAATAAHADPVPAMLAKWKGIRDHFDTMPTATEEEDMVVYRQMRRAEDDLVDAQPTSREGVVAQLEYLIEDDAFRDGCDLHVRAVQNALAALKSGALIGA